MPCEFAVYFVYKCLYSVGFFSLSLYLFYYCCVSFGFCMFCCYAAMAVAAYNLADKATNLYIDMFMNWIGYVVWMWIETIWPIRFGLGRNRKKANILIVFRCNVSVKLVIITYSAGVRTETRNKWARQISTNWSLESVNAVWWSRFSCR